MIMTSRDDQSGAAQLLSAEITARGTHNVVVVSDEKYGSATKLSLLDRLMDTGQEYQYLLERKDRGVLRDKLKVRKFSKRVNRINNMLKRFHPEFILCTTPYAHHCAVEAKKKIRFTTKIIYLMMSFTVPKRGVDGMTDTFLVESADVKASLVRAGISSKSIMTLGLPIVAKAVPADEREGIKSELGLKDKKTVYVSLQDKQALENVFSLLLDQGDIANLVVKIDNQKLRQSLSLIAQKAPDINIIFLVSKEKYDEYLSVADVVITSYDVPLIFKCMLLGVAPIVFSNDEHTEQDVMYLLSNNLIARAKEDIDVVALLYKLLQTDLADKIVANGKKRTEQNSIENFTNFLITYLGV